MNQPVTDYIAYYGRLCGAQSSGGVSCGAVPKPEELKAAYDLGVKLAGDIKEKRQYPEQVTQIENRRRYFAETVKRRKDAWDGEYRYYVSKGWL